jgi:4-hydroxy-tetrahydrodipicolinate synthase
MRPEELRGVFSPLATPFTSTGEVDDEAFQQDVEYCLSKGVHGISVTGTTGEGVMLTPEEHGRVCRLAVEQVQGRVPVFSGVIADSTRQAVHLCRLARDAGANGVMVAPVHYHHNPTEDGMFEYFNTVWEKVGLPIVIYNVIPTAYVREQLALRLAEIPGLIGIKQSLWDFAQLNRTLYAAGDRLAIMTAVDELVFPSLMIGTHGVYAAIATTLPGHCVELYNHVRANRIEEARNLHWTISIVARATSVETVNFPVALKYALELQGRRMGTVRSPLTPLDEAGKAKVRRALESAGII